jgi:hypothetical protein
MALQEESLSDLSINSLNNQGITGEEGTYYPLGSVQVVKNDGVLLQDYLTDKNIPALNIPFIAKDSTLNNAIENIAKFNAQSNELQSIGIISLGAVAAFLAIAKSRMQKSKKSKKDRDNTELLLAKNRMMKVEKEKSRENKSTFIKKVKVLLLSLLVNLK